MAPRPARLCLADGTTFEGHAVGARGVAGGEVVFTTGMTGYQEVLTDPSYSGQLVVMTAPMIGNTGVNDDDGESLSGRPMAAGFIVRELSRMSSNHRSQEDIEAYLERHGIVALTGVDTRALTLHLRERGVTNGAIGEASKDELVAKARAMPSMEGLDLAGAASVSAPRSFTTESPKEFRTLDGDRSGTAAPHVVTIDLGIKKNILRSLVDTGFRVTVVPAHTTADEVLALSPDGVFLSNGPGDPAAVTYAVDTVKSLLGKKPMFGICLGHQLLGLALGASTFKLKFGHRGLNQPVLDVTTGRVEITTQNHGFCVDVATLPKGVRSSHVHLNDGTSEGIELAEAKAFSVQYHPEAAAGPHDTLHLFQRFFHAVVLGGPS